VVIQDVCALALLPSLSSASPGVALAGSAHPRTLPIGERAAHVDDRLALGEQEAGNAAADPAGALDAAAGVNPKALSTYLGHSSIQITLDRYGHLMPGNEDEAVALVDAHLERATGRCFNAANASTPLQRR
jgi:hypothetical protein